MVSSQEDNRCNYSAIASSERVSQHQDCHSATSSNDRRPAVAVLAHISTNPAAKLRKSVPALCQRPRNSFFIYFGFFYSLLVVFFFFKLRMLRLLVRGQLRGVVLIIKCLTQNHHGVPHSQHTPMRLSTDMSKITHKNYSDSESQLLAL